MVRMFARHSVDDYGKWRKAYDDFHEERQGMGVTDHGVFRHVGDSDEVTVHHDFENMAAAEAFVSSPRLRETMEGAGVQGQPDIWIAEEG